MRMMKSTIFRVTTGVAGAYHLILGLALCLLPAGSLNGAARLFLGVGLDIDPQLAMAARFSSAYILVFGIMLILLCREPRRLRVLVVPALVLFGIRLINKLVWMGTLEESLGVSRGRGMLGIGMLAAIFGLILFTMPRGREPQES